MIPATSGTYFGIVMTAGDVYTVAGMVRLVVLEFPVSPLQPSFPIREARPKMPMAT